MGVQYVQIIPPQSRKRRHHERRRTTVVLWNHVPPWEAQLQCQQSNAYVFIAKRFLAGKSSFLFYMKGGENINDIEVMFTTRKSSLLPLESIDRIDHYENLLHISDETQLLACTLRLALFSVRLRSTIELPMRPPHDLTHFSS
jgi:hypothetical protein